MPDITLPSIERREFSLAEFRVAKDDAAPAKRSIDGYPAVFNKDSEVMWGFVERIAPGAFSEAIEKDDIRALYNHDPNFVLGRNRSKTLELSEDKVGLRMSVEPPDVQWARDLLVSMERGDVTQGSFGFRMLPGGDSWDIDKKGLLIRTLNKVRLFDVSVVTFPAYPDTEVDARSMEQLVQQGRERAKDPAFDRYVVERTRALALAEVA